MKAGKTLLLLVALIGAALRGNWAVAQCTHCSKRAFCTHCVSSQDLINIETARSMWLDNRHKSVRIYFQRRTANIRGQADMDVERYSSRQMKLIARETHLKAVEERKRYLAAKAEHDSLERLAKLDLRYQIPWPRALKHPKFADQRSCIEKFFSSSDEPRLSTPPSDRYEVQMALAGMREQLKHLFKQVGESQYTAGKRFLGDLEVAVSRPASTSLAQID